MRREQSQSEPAWRRSLHLNTSSGIPGKAPLIFEAANHDVAVSGQFKQDFGFVLREPV